MNHEDPDHRRERPHATRLLDARAAGDADYTLRIQVARYKLYRGRQETLCVACGREPDAREHTRPSRGWEMFGDHA